MRTGAIEAGGTKFVVAVGDAVAGRVDVAITIPVTTPAETLDAASAWLRREHASAPLQSLGIASFGPVDLHRSSPTYGYITSTPKPGWRDTDIVGHFRERLPDLPIGFDTDVNGAALGEHLFGAAQGLSDFVYLTIGTGIGGGGLTNGKRMRGMSHPEMGHLLLARASGDDPPGICPYHGDCWEGLCSGKAIERRYGAPCERLAVDHPGWEHVVSYSATALASLICVLSPRRIIMGGSVRKGGLKGERWFFDSIRRRTVERLNGYLRTAPIERYLVPPGRGDEAGIVGALALGRLAREDSVVSDVGANL
jgi:fructokinase